VAFWPPALGKLFYCSREAVTPSYQPVPETDYEQFAAHSQLAFGDDPATTLRWLRDAPRLSEARGIYDAGQLVSQLELYPLQVQGGHAPIGCVGIGAVATPPNQRRRGYVEAGLRGACAEARERGMPIGMLGAFKESFYGRYGWAVFGERRKYRGEPALFAPFKLASGRFVAAHTEDIAELDAIYRAALRGRFAIVYRSEDWWRKAVLYDAYWERQQLGYIWRDADGRGRSYLIYRIAKEGDKQVVRVRDIVALDPEARGQLFALLANFRDHVEEIEFAAPADAPVNLLFPDSLECRTEPLDMLRIIDLEMLLNAYAYPRDVQGSLTLAVQDDWLAHNSGVFRLEVADGVGHVVRLASSSDAGLRCDIRTLVPIISRHLRPRTAAAFGMLEASNRSDLGLAEQLFTGQAPYLMDRF
jgi:predicted acetyltransferase